MPSAIIRGPRRAGSWELAARLETDNWHAARYTGHIPMPRRSGRALLLISWFWLTCLPASATAAPHQPATYGRIEGRVVDARTAEGLARVLVAVEDGGPATHTDDDGRFELPRVPAGTRRLIVSVVGYGFARRDVTVAPGSRLDLVIPLAEGTGTYTETVTVAADAFSLGDRGVASQQVLGSAEIQSLRGVAADDPLRAVQALPGVATGDDLRSEFTVRGSGFSRMNLVVDGFSTPFLLHTVRAVEDYSASGSVAMINSDTLEDVTLLNGGYAQRFGNRTGAAVEFRLREGSRERRQVRAAVSGTNASTVLEGPLGHARRGSWLVSGRQSFLDLIVERLVDEGLHFGFSDAQAKLVYDLTPRQRVEVAALGGRSRLDIRRDTLDADDLFTAGNASIVGIGSWRLTGAHGLVSARLLGARNRFGNDALSGVRLDDGFDNQAGGRLDGRLVLTPALELEGAVHADWTEQGRTRQRFIRAANFYPVINQYGSRATRSGAYAQIRWTTGALTIIPGARVDRWSLTGEGTASPWLLAEWQAAPSLFVRGGTGIYRQFPDFEQVLGTWGQPTNRSERAAHYDLGVEQRLSATLRWRVSLYDREERGVLRRPGAETRLVDGHVVRGTTSARYEPSLEGYARGVELLVQRRSPNGVAGWIAYSYGRTRYHDTQTGESFWGDHDQRHTLNLYAFYRLSDRTSASLKLRAGSNSPAPGYYSEVPGGYMLIDRRNELRLPTYSRLDLRANRTFQWGDRRLTLFAEVMNVLNRANVRFNPPSVSNTGVLRHIFERMIPVIPSAGLLVEF